MRQKCSLKLPRMGLVGSQTMSSPQQVQKMPTLNSLCIDAGKQGLPAKFEPAESRCAAAKGRRCRSPFGPWRVCAQILLAASASTCGTDVRAT